MTPEETSELMYKPLPGEWGERSRDAECERIVAGIDQLITVGVYARKQALCCLLSIAHFHTFGPNPLASSPGFRQQQNNFFPSMLTHLPTVFLL